MKARPTRTSRGLVRSLESRNGAILLAVLVSLCICLVLVLPPIALPSRILAAGYTSVVKSGVVIQDPDGTVLRIPEGAVKSGSSIKLTATAQKDIGTNPLAQGLPAYLEIKSPLYGFAIQGERPKESTLVVPIPNNADPNETLDLYSLYNQTWFKVPFVLNEQEQHLESNLNFVPDAVVVAQTKPLAPLIGANIASKNSVLAPAAQVLVEINPAGLHLSDQGTIAGDVINIPETSASSTFAIVPTVSNVDQNGARLDLTENMLGDNAQRTAHINALVDLAVQKLYSGYNLAYEGLSESDQDAYTAFIKELAQALHAKQKILSVTLPQAKPISDDRWDTSGYDWALLGRYADEIKVPFLSDPKTYEGDAPLVGQYLQWAVGQVDRYKLQFLFSPMGQDQAGDQSSAVAYNSALKLLGPVNIPQPIKPGQDVTLDLPRLREGGGIQSHAASGLYYFNYKDDKGAQHTVWLENANSLAKKIALLIQYNIRGIQIGDVDNKAGGDPRIWSVLGQYRSLQIPTIQDNLTIVWVIDGQPVGKSAANDPKFVWKAPAAGQHTVDVAFSADGGETTSLTAGAQALNIQAAAATAVPPTAKPTKEPTQVLTPGTPRATSTPKPTTEARPTAVAVTPTKAPPPAVSSNFVGRNMFGYGLQINWGSSPIGVSGEMSTIRSMGFGWAKAQIRWCDVEGGSKGNLNFDGMDGLVSTANAQGVTMLFSVVCGPGWTGAVTGCGGCNPGPPSNPDDLADFLGTIASRYCGRGLGAIEVWNEENLRTEWGRNPIDPNDYMRYARVAFPRIKQSCSSIVVVSGALTPTGANYADAMEDLTYLRGLYAAGIKGYSDAIGAHPSGYNNPPDVPAGWTDPANPGQCCKGHYSWYFRGVMDNYRNTMVANGDGAKQIWPTEFGWGVTNSPAPGYEYERDNTEQKQADWLVKAYQLMKGWRYVGVAFTWNLDFNNSNADNRAFAILGRSAQGALAGMAK